MMTPDKQPVAETLERTCIKGGLIEEAEKLLANFPRRRLMPLSDWEVERVCRLTAEAKANLEWLEWADDLTGNQGYSPSKMRETIETLLEE